MNKFIIKTLLFLSPFILLQLFTLLKYQTKHGDLIRIGHVYELNSEYRENLNDELKGEKYFETINDISVSDKNIKYLLIGDSFTLDEHGYKNYLGFLEGKPVTDFNLELLVNGNPIQTVASLCKTDFFKNNKVKYVVLQSVERYLSKRVIDFNDSIKFSKTVVSKTEKLDYHLKLSDQEFPNKSIFTFPYQSIKYIYGANKIGKVFRYDTDIPLFSGNRKEIMFYKEDLDNIEQNNLKDNYTNLNNILNDIQEELSKQNVQLIFLPAPNKYTAYYDHILDNKVSSKSIVLGELETLSKKYLYVNTLKLINDFNQSGNQDFYYFDDTHWSFNGSKEVAKEIQNITK